MGVIDEIKATVTGWINQAVYKAKSYAYGLYDSVWSYSSQISKDLWKETGLIWTRIGEIPVLTRDTIIRWVSPYIEKAKAYAEEILCDAILIIDRAIVRIGNTIDSIEDTITDIKKDMRGVKDWVTGADGWFADKLDRAKDSIIDYIVEKFEYILDKVFYKEAK